MPFSCRFLYFLIIQNTSFILLKSPVFIIYHYVSLDLILARYMLLVQVFYFGSNPPLQFLLQTGKFRYVI
jgi:hypothetical protein